MTLRVLEFDIDSLLPDGVITDAKCEPGFVYKDKNPCERCRPWKTPVGGRRLMAHCVVDRIAQMKSILRRNVHLGDTVMRKVFNRRKLQVCFSDIYEQLAKCNPFERKHCVICPKGRYNMNLGPGENKIMRKKGRYNDDDGMNALNHDICDTCEGGKYNNKTGQTNSV